MTQTFISGLRKALTIAVALLPWMLASYAFYWLDSSGTWTSDKPHRGKMSVTLLSFFLWSMLSGRNRK